MSGVVDTDDYSEWKAAYGQTGTYLAADGNGDGRVDAGDYVVWRNNLGREALPRVIEDHVMLQGGVLTICGTIFDDVITVSNALVEIEGIGTFAIDIGSVSEIVVHAFGGNDIVEIAPSISVPAKLFGGTGDDVLGGGSGPDLLDGGAGADVLYGGDGDDMLRGGSGDDLLFGNFGEDILYLGEGANILYGGPDTDEYRAEDDYLDDLVLDDDQTITVIGPLGTPNHHPQINPVPANHHLTVDQPFSLQLTAIDPDSPPQALAWFANGPLPAGASFSNGHFTWTPTAAQNGVETTIQFIVQDDGLSPLSDTRTLSFSVSAPSLARPIIADARHDLISSIWRNTFEIPFVAGASLSGGYIIERRLPGGEWTEIGTALNGITRMFFRDTTLPQTGEVYEYRVKVRNNATGAESPYSLPIAMPAPLRDVVGLSATRQPNGTVNLSWSYFGTPNPTGFRIERMSTAAPVWNVISSVAGDIRTYTDSSAVSSEAYAYRVVAYAGVMESFFLASSSFATVTAPSVQLRPADQFTGNQPYWFPYLSDAEEESVGVFIGVDNDFDEGNRDADGELVPDNKPDAIAGNRIVFPYTDVGYFYYYSGVLPQVSYPSPVNKVKVWGTVAPNGSWVETPNGGAITVNSQFRVEGIAPSATIRDTPLTLTVDYGGGDVRTDTVNLTVVDIDLQIAGLENLQEHTTGALIRRNSDFSKQNVAAGSGAIIPDYEKDGNLDQYVFDPNYETDYTQATVTWNADVHTELDILFEFPENILVWDVTNWDGSEATRGSIPLITSGQAFTSATDYLDLWIEGLDRSPRFATDQISVSLVQRGAPFPRKIDTDVSKYTVVDINALVDGNRNGTIDAAEPEDRSLVFWYNSDREGTYGQDGPVIGRDAHVQSDVTSPATGFDGFRDSRDQFITHTRDLEDFAPLSLYLDPLLVNSPNVSFEAYVTLNGNSGITDAVQIRLFNTATGIEGDSRQHVMDGSVGSQQVTTNRFEVVTAFEELDISSFQRFLQGELSAGANSFLFEAVPQLQDGGVTFPDIDDVFPNRQVELVFNVKVNFGDGLSQTLQSKVSLDLHDITEFYDTFVVDHTNGTGQDQRMNPDAGPYTGYNQTTTAVVNDLEGSGFNNSDYILFVHGWNMRPEDKKAFAETNFKRLYWQGYSGRFGTFDWPTFFDAQGPHGPDAWFGGEGRNLTYFASEVQAWRSGEALKNVLSGLRQPDTMGNVHVNVMAHSMGTYVATEAMRRWRLQNTAPLVDTYVAMQGAISSGVYGTNNNDGIIIGGPSLLDLYRYFPTGVPQVDPIDGRPYMSDVTNTSATWSQIAVTNRVNIYNPQDFALGAPIAWPGANNAKPFIGNQAPVETWPYRYELMLNNGVVTGLRRIHRTTGAITGLFDDVVENGHPGPTAYEVMAFMSIANDAPVGTKIVDWFGENIDIRTLGVDETTPGLDPRIRPNHSFQFNHDTATTWNFWTRVMNEIGLTSTYDQLGSGSLALSAKDAQLAVDNGINGSSVARFEYIALPSSMAVSNAVDSFSTTMSTNVLNSATHTVTQHDFLMVSRMHEIDDDHRPDEASNRSHIIDEAFAISPSDKCGLGCKDLLRNWWESLSDDYSELGYIKYPARR